MTNVLTLPAAAKINLTLLITGRRADGFHILDSLIGFAGLADQLSFSPGEDIRLTLSGPEASHIESGDENLVVRAARLAQRHVGTSRGVHIILEKNIPVAAGLGGGSADAAATIDGCLKLWTQEDAAPLSNDTLAAELGADVPVCRFSHPAKIGGIGEQISPALGWPPVWLVLVNPRVPLSTAEVFRAYDGRFREADPLLYIGASFRDFTAFLAAQSNDLTGAACTAAPVVGQVLQDISMLPDCALSRMSGSGPTCFGLFETQAAAEAAAESLSQTRPDWWIRATPLHTNQNA